MNGITNFFRFRKGPNLAPLMVVLSVLSIFTLTSCEELLSALGVRGAERIIIQAPNDVSVSVGSTETISVNLQNETGGDVTDGFEELVWNWETTEIASLAASGQSGIMSGLSAGTGILTITHPRAASSKTIPITVRAGAVEPQPTEKFLETRSSGIIEDVGEVFFLSVTFHNATTLEAAEILWSSQNTEIVQLVGNSGSNISAQAIAVGTTNIIISHPNSVNALTISVTVQALTDPTRSKSIRVGDIPVTLEVAERVEISASIRNGVENDTELISWSVSDTDVLQLFGASGSRVAIEGLQPGTVDVTISHPDVQTPITRTLTVLAINKILTVSNNAVSATVGSDPETLTASISRGTDSDYLSLLWSITDDDPNNEVASLSGSGRTVSVRPLNPGNATITVSLPDTDQTQTISFVVTQKDISMSLNPRTLDLLVYETATETITATVRNGSAQDYNNIEWTIVDSDVAILTGSGRTATVRSNAVGTTTITAALPVYNVSEQVTVNVTDDRAISVSNNFYDLVENDPAEIITASVTRGAPADTDNLVWSVADNNPDANVVTIAGSGRSISVRPLVPGTATITVSLPGTSLSQLITVTVAMRDISISLLPTTLDLLIYETSTRVINATLRNGTSEDYNNLEWSIADSSVATLNGSGSTGAVVPAALGTTTITVYLPTYDISAQVTVNVTDDRSITVSRTFYEFELTDAAQSISASVRRGLPTDTDDLVWTVTDDNPTDDVITLSGIGGSRQIRPEAVGEAQILITLPGTSLMRLVTVNVSEPVVITLSSQANVEPGESVDIPFTVTPADTSLSVSVDNPTLATAQLIGSGSSRILRVTGASSEGRTNVTISAGTTSDNIQVEIEYERRFTISTANINVQPGQTVYRNFTVYPPSEINMITWTFPSTVADVSVDQVNSRLVITGLREGNVRVSGRFTSTPVNITILSEFTDTTGFVTYSGLQGNYYWNGVEDHGGSQGAITVYAQTMITPTIDPRFNVSSTAWTPRDDNGTIRWRNTGNVFTAECHNDGHFDTNDPPIQHATVHFTFYHGAYGTTEYKQAIIIGCDTF